MANKFLLILLFIFASANAGMIYRRYQKEHKNYVQVVEIFGTKRRPPHFIESEKALNDFLGRDAFKTDMNCTEETTKKVQTTTKKSVVTRSTTKSSIVTSSSPSPPKTTTKPRDYIPTTVYMDHMVTYSPPPFPKLPAHPTRAKSTTRQPNLDNLFTIRTTKPTIKANPKENENPDYQELFNWSTTTKSSNTPTTGSSLNNIDYGSNNNEFSGEFENENSEEFDEELPEEDFAESDDEIDEDDDDDVMKRRKRFHSRSVRHSRGLRAKNYQ